MADRSMPTEEAEGSPASPPRVGRDLGSVLVRSVKIASLILVLVLLGLAIAAWLAGGDPNLPFEYEGFD